VAAECSRKRKATCGPRVGLGFHRMTVGRRGAGWAKAAARPSRPWVGERSVFGRRLAGRSRTESNAWCSDGRITACQGTPDGRSETPRWRGTGDMNRAEPLYAPHRRPNVPDTARNVGPAPGTHSEMGTGFEDCNLQPNAHRTTGPVLAAQHQRLRSSARQWRC
jgi:hypothetical protein